MPSSVPDLPLRRRSGLGLFLATLLGWCVSVRSFCFACSACKRRMPSWLSSVLDLMLTSGYSHTVVTGTGGRGSVLAAAGHRIVVGALEPVLWVPRLPTRALLVGRSGHGLSDGPDGPVNCALDGPLHLKRFRDNGRHGRPIHRGISLVLSGA